MDGKEKKLFTLEIVLKTLVMARDEEEADKLVQRLYHRIDPSVVRWKAENCQGSQSPTVILAAWLPVFANGFYFASRLRSYGGAAMV